MGWERRGKAGKLFFYRTRRTSTGKVVKEYCGDGPRAEAAALAVARSRAKREADRQAVQEEQARLADPEELTAELVRAAQTLLEAALLSNGYHRPNFGKWRRKRYGQEERSRTAAQLEGPG